jgi:hypothetical protein
MVSLLAFFLNTDTPPAMAGRLRMPGAGLFAVILNLRAVSEILGSVDGMALRAPHHLPTVHRGCLARNCAILAVAPRQSQ